MLDNPAEQSRETGQSGRRSTTMVKGPGQMAVASFSASFENTPRRNAASTSATWEISGLNCGRCLAAQSRCRRSLPTPILDADDPRNPPPLSPTIPATCIPRHLHCLLPATPSTQIPAACTPLYPQSLPPACQSIHDPRRLHPHPPSIPAARNPIRPLSLPLKTPTAQTPTAQNPHRSQPLPLTAPAAHHPIRTQPCHDRDQPPRPLYSAPAGFTSPAPPTRHPDGIPLLPPSPRALVGAGAGRPVDRHLYHRPRRARRSGSHGARPPRHA